MSAGILESLAVIFGVAAAAGLLTYGVYTARLARHDRRMADSFTGDCLNVPPEGVSRSTELSGAGWSEAKADRLDTQHDSGTRTVAARRDV